MFNSERAYVDLMFRATKKYPAWDPEIVLKAGDYGIITRGQWGLAFWRKNCTFVREGNIYLDGKAEKYGIVAPVEYGHDSEGQAWITSLNATQVDASCSAGGLHPLIAQCNAKAAFKFSSGRGAVLAMENPMITIIDPPVEPPLPVAASAGAVGTWVRHGASGNFKSQVDMKGERAFHPLFRLVSRSEEETSTGIGPVDSV
ncbi:hypothetical protein B0H14DRAFT_2671013 [Mycena olivaceomarginata]|nr:hypothetical protein B0H14DRAFT_2671013 [Mycena olivaceomarginata]